MSNIDPREIASFADLVAKMNQLDRGEAITTKSNHISEGLKANDMTSILENMYRSKPFESAKGLPAEYDMPNQSPVLGSDEEKNVYGDYFVGEEVDIEDKGEYDQEGDMAKGDLNRAADAALELESILSDSDNLPEWVQAKITKALDYLDTARDYMKSELEEGYKVLPPMNSKYTERTGLEGPFSTLSGKVVYYDPKEGSYYDPDTDMYISYDDFQALDNDYRGMNEGPNPGDEESWDGVSPGTSQIAGGGNSGYKGPVDPEGEVSPTQLSKVTKEDQVSKKRSIMDYLKDADYKTKEDVIKEPVKSYTTANGKTIKIFGDEDDGYRVKVNGKESKSSFGKLDDAVQACESFLQRAAPQNLDYMDEC
tara:strand:+ start:159 stop:1259 length:1101 start_codon:yes stop_codon:yes gene_type:complete